MLCVVFVVCCVLRVGCCSGFSVVCNGVCCVFVICMFCFEWVFCVVMSVLCVLTVVR